MAAASQRITFTFDPEAFARLQRVKSLGGYKTMAEAVRAGLVEGEAALAKRKVRSDKRAAHAAKFKGRKAA